MTVEKIVQTGVGIGPLCQLCAAVTEIHHVASQGVLYRCLRCGFVFFRSRATAYHPMQTFARAYTGNERAAGMGDFFLKTRLRLDADAAGIDPARLLNSAQQDARAVIRQRFPHGATILDIGCATGYFMRTMQADGYELCGVDVAWPVVQLTRRDGFPVWHGTIDSVPDEWVNPDVCTVFFVLHHTLHAVEFLRTVRMKFPGSLVMLAVYNDLDGGTPLPHARRLPPRTYSWWGTAHLQTALEAAGYQAAVRSVPRRATDGGVPASMGLYTWLRRRSPAAAGRFLRHYYGTLPFWGWAPILWDSWIRRFSDPLLGIGIPQAASPP